jgi:hypothetical protein
MQETYTSINFDRFDDSAAMSWMEAVESVVQSALKDAACNAPRVTDKDFDRNTNTTNN